MTPESPGPWVERAACKAAPPGAFLVEVNDLYNHRRTALEKACRAKHWCAGCPVLDECRAWAMTEPDPAYCHVAGGMDPLERQRRRVARRRAS